MTNLRDSSRQGNIQGIHAALWGELLDLDENYAESYLDWCMKQLKENKRNNRHLELKNSLRRADKTDKAAVEGIQKQIKHVKPKGYPRDISRGDIVLVQFGINLGDEISDLQRDQTMKKDHGHYSIVLAQKGFMFLVVPLSSQVQRNPKAPDMEMSIKDLGIGDSNESHVVFNQMQSVNIRRIKNIQSFLPEGKTSLKPDVLLELEDKIVKFMGIDYKSKHLSLEKNV